MRTLLVTVCVLAVSLSVSVLADINSCTFTDSKGKKYDLSPLISKDEMAYSWTQSLWDTSNNMLTNPDFSGKQNYSFQLQICHNISKPIHQACNVSAATYMYNPVTKSCLSFGRLDVATFEENPFGDGVHLNLYYGDTVTHTMRYKGKIYFVCDKTKDMDGPVFEHLKDNYDGHFRINTKYAC